MNEKNIILKVVVGSQAHGLADEKSDFDYRGVFVLPTRDLLDLSSINGKYKAVDWFEGKEDQTLYEIGHFLFLATKCNPSILEVFKSPIAGCNPDTKIHLTYGHALRSLFPYVWNPIDAFNAFTGYSKNQEVKMLKDETPCDRVPKFACAYLRTLYNLEQLLTTGDFKMDVTHNPEMFKRLKDIRKGNFTLGDVLDEARLRKEKCKNLLEYCKQKPDLDRVNDFLLKIRKEFLD